MAARPLHIRLMTPDDLPFAGKLSEDTGWNQTADDWRRFLNYQPDGCFIAEWDGELAGTVTTTCYGKLMAWIGMLLVLPEHRGRGIGTALLTHAIDHLRQRGVGCIKLDATPQGQPIYERMGFRAEWSMQRWETKAPHLPTAREKFRTRRWRDADTESLVALDIEAFGADRRAMLRRINDDVSRWLVNESPKGRVNGFGLVRKGVRAVYLGPVVAEHLSAAGALIKSLLQPLAKQRVCWDIPDHQAEMIQLARSLGFHPQRSLVRMYLGGRNIPGKPEMIYAIAAPEIG